MQSINEITPSAVKNQEVYRCAASLTNLVSRRYVLHSKLVQWNDTDLANSLKTTTARMPSKQPKHVLCLWNEDQYDSFWDAANGYLRTLFNDKTTFWKTKSNRHELYQKVLVVALLAWKGALSRSCNPDALSYIEQLVEYEVITWTLDMPLTHLTKTAKNSWSTITPLTLIYRSLTHSLCSLTWLACFMSHS